MTFGYKILLFFDDDKNVTFSLVWTSNVPHCVVEVFCHMQVLSSLPRVIDESASFYNWSQSRLQIEYFSSDSKIYTNSPSHKFEIVDMHLH